MLYKVILINKYYRGANMSKEPKKLYRSKENKIIAGVCGGIAEYFNIDPIWIRLAMVLLFFADGIGLIIYVLAWILVPRNPKQKRSPDTHAEIAAKRVHATLKNGYDNHEGNNHKGCKHLSKNKGNIECCSRGTILLGVVFIVLGGAFLMKNLFSWFSFHYVWPVLLIGIGVYFLMRGAEK